MLTHPFASDLEETPESSELTVTTAAIGEEGGEPIPIVEGKPKISIQNAEGFEEEGIITVNVILDRPSLERVTVKYLTFDYDQGAKAWKDFIPEKSHLVFEPGETEKQISIKLNDDQLGEFSKSLAVKLFKAKNAKIDDGVAIVELKDGDELADSNPSQPLISINNQTTLLELQASELEFSIFLDEASDQEVVINYKTFEISAQADTDFIPQTGSLTFSAGELEKTLIIPLLNNPSLEPEDKVFGIELYDPINGKFSPVNADNIGIGAILTKPIKHNGNFEQIITTELPGNKKPNLTISDGVFANEIIRFQVTLSEPSDKEISVKYFTFVDTEMEELEGGIQKDTLVFLPGETQKTITIPNGNYWEKLGLDWTEVDFSSFGVKLFKAKNANVIDDIGIGKLDFPVTTAAIGEEGGIDDPIVTTSAMGEEGGSYDPITTEAIGEEGGSDDGGATTLALGEEGGSYDPITTEAIGEEGGSDDGGATTLAFGEEGGGDDEFIFTTEAIGEEGGGNDGGATTKAIGEEGGIDNGATTLALGEEGGSNDDNVSYTTLALGEEGGLETTMAIGEEGGDWGNASIDVLDVM